MLCGGKSGDFPFVLIDKVQRMLSDDLIAVVLLHQWFFNVLLIFRIRLFSSDNLKILPVFIRICGLTIRFYRPDYMYSLGSK